MSFISPSTTTSPSFIRGSHRFACFDSSRIAASVVGCPFKLDAGSNVLALGPGRALALDGNSGTRKRMKGAGVEVTVYRGDEISEGDGGPTCLTRPLLRD
jgi:arginine deiminase